MKYPGIEALTVRIEQAMAALIATQTKEKSWVTHYGANDIHPKHLVYWVCVQTDREKKRLIADYDLMLRLRSLLVEHEYPAEGRTGVFVGFESQQTVDRDSQGNWWYHWK